MVVMIIGAPVPRRHTPLLTRAGPMARDTVAAVEERNASHMHPAVANVRQRVAGAMGRAARAVESRWGAPASTPDPAPALPAMRAVVQSVPQSLWLIDYPTVTEPWPTPGVFEMNGWVASPGPVTGLRFTHPAMADVRLEPVDRPDIVDVYGLPVTGFRASAPLSAGVPPVVELVYESLGETHSISIPGRDVALPEHARRSAKQQRLLPHLMCLSCSTVGELAAAVDGLRCRVCERRYPVTTNAWDFLDDATRANFGIVDTTNVSSNTYDGIALNMIAELQDGLILDCGAGSQAHYFPNVVNLEIADYTSTDVLAVGERLPFADATFDAVFSFAVLEHVLNPTTCVEEIKRVLKPGGVVYCQVPFLQPVHAYPNHYFNMTSHGLTSLFAELDVRHVGSFPFGQPIFGLSWFLNVYAASLPDETRAAFLATSVGDLLTHPDGMLAKDFVIDLDEGARDTLSCCNYLLAVKPTR